MKRGLILLFLLLPFAAFCREKHKPLKLVVGRWREVRRMSLDSAVQSFTDTLFLSIRRKDSFSYHVKDGFVYNGGYTIDEDSLIDFGTAKYKITVKRPFTLVLKDTKGFYVMGPDNSDTAKIDLLPKEDSTLPVKSIETMVGRWSVYKKVTERTAESIDFGSEIKTVCITGPGSDGKQGYVFGGLDGSNHPTWYVKELASDQTLICSGKTTRNIKVTRCQNGEMIIEDDGIKYFLKQFR